MDPTETDIYSSTPGTPGLENSNNADNSVITGGAMDYTVWAKSNGIMTFWVSVISVSINIILLLLIIMGYYTWGKSTTSSTYSSSFDPKYRSKFSVNGNLPNWRMGAGDAGMGSTVDIPGSGSSLGFDLGEECPIHKSNYVKSPMRPTPRPGVSNFNPAPGVNSVVTPSPRQGVSNFGSTADARRIANERMHNKSNMENPSVEERQAMENKARQEAEIARAEREARVKKYEEDVMRSCNDKWDPMASEEAKVLASVGSYRNAYAGMGTFNKVIAENCNSTLSDAQLEAIMQGGEPFSVSPFVSHATIKPEWDQLKAQNQAMNIQHPGMR
jgi:hypothetical protein